MMQLLCTCKLSQEWDGYGIDYEALYQEVVTVEEIPGLFNEEQKWELKGELNLVQDCFSQVVIICKYIQLQKHLYTMSVDKKEFFILIISVVSSNIM